MFLKITNNQKGVTLVEIIVALAILTIVLGLVFSIFGFGNRSFSRGNVQYAVQSEARLVSDYVQQNVRNATYLEVLSKDEAIEDMDEEDDSIFEYIIFDPIERRMVHWKMNGDDFSIYRSLGQSVASLSFLAQNETTLKIQVVDVDGEGQEGGLNIYSTSSEFALSNLSLDESEIKGGESYDVAIKFSTDPSELGFLSRLQDPDQQDPGTEATKVTEISGKQTQNKYEFTVTFSRDIKSVDQYPDGTSLAGFEPEDNFFTAEGEISNNTPYKVVVTDINNNTVTANIWRTGNNNWHYENL
ncbi:prepilin-type N-terminal cleavage/methylation domain-containing protein [Isachenkonia alkalipeptolytica]|uniref:Prepilin-type N-terminal cleavage/methylation domain-containing protein n=1 Tax=Isachenkonia alkalipeptolytica TaxID=2565777 RepID=A0AA43XIQ7_9CLOT|nr:prepilin-type N-terminal cleavage/methylation domain-containing protein [Isachenkonia alkalipeptolytica]NBG87528.1 prepilin-type N-terminal cleavage/methylation domain-containing protein [Isachenkonia alkalipeptolytica]